MELLQRNEEMMRIFNIKNRGKLNFDQDKLSKEKKKLIDPIP
ncbi:hypothetical protein ACSIGC_17950 (plasmid) [Tenacibaculum sp. ZS6-P6]